MKSFLAIINRSNRLQQEQVMMNHLKNVPLTQQQFVNIQSFENAVFVNDFSGSTVGTLNAVRSKKDRFLILCDGLGQDEKWEDDRLISDLFTNRKLVNEFQIREFALLIWDSREGQLLAFRDQIGIRPLYYYSDDQWLIVSSGIDLIRSTGITNSVINEEWISDSLVNLSSSIRNTFYKNINLLEAGQYLLYREQKVQIEGYYNLYDSISRSSGSFTEMAMLLKEKLNLAVESYLTKSTNIGAELSGGLDSSAIVSMGSLISRNRNIQFHTFSSVLSDDDIEVYYPFSDESEYSELLINSLGIASHHRFQGLNRGILTELKSHVRLMGSPTQQLFTLFCDEIYEKATAEGIQVLFSGFGGDEGISYNGAGYFDELAREGKWGLYLHEMNARNRLQNTPLVKGHLKYLIERFMPFGSDLLLSFKRSNHWKKMKIKGFSYNEAFGEKMNIESRYMLRKGYPNDPEILKRQYYRLIHPQVSQRLAYAFQVGVKHDFSYVFPLLNKDLLEFHLSLPSKYKYLDGYGRAIFRESLKGVLPESIRLRTDKRGTTIPSVHKRMLKDYNPIKDLILTSKRENKYHYINYDKMLVWQGLLKNRKLRNDIPYNPSAFYNSLQILVLQEMERTGEFKSGIFY